MIDTQEIHPLTDFLRNHETHLARIKETRAPEVLTVNGRAKLVLLDAESYEALMEQLEHDAQVAAVRTLLLKAKGAGPREEVPEVEYRRERQSKCRSLHRFVQRVSGSSSRLRS